MSGRLPGGIVALGLVSLFMDISSEMIHGLLPVFLVGVLAAPVALVGLIEGLGEAMAALTKLVSGALSDRRGRRKPLALLGYGISALCKPLFALAASPGMVLVARVSDRVGKGIRGAPRDALVADLVPADRRGAAYGLRQSLDTIGAVLGPVVAMVLLSAGVEIRTVFWLAILPAIVAVAILAFAVREPETPPAKDRLRPSFSRATLSALGGAFWRIVALGAVLTFARISEAFLILHASGNGLDFAFAPLVLVVMNVVYALAAWPAGSLSDRIGRRGLLALGIGVLALADLVLALAPGLGAVLAGVALWGLHMGLTQGLLTSAVADAAPPALRATAFGVFNLVSGGALLASGVATGLVWDMAGPSWAFALSGTGAVIVLVFWRRRA